MEDKVRIFKSLGNETRLSIVKELARRSSEVASSDILSGCSKALDLAQPTLSQHFSRLVEAGVLVERRQGVEKYYRLNTSILDEVGIDINKL